MKIKPQQKPTLTPIGCPFCGEAPSLSPDNPDLDGNAWGEVACLNDDCPATPSVTDGESISDDRGSGAYIDAAIRLWNKRAT